MVADTEELEEMDASEIHARRLNSKGSDNAAKKWKLHVPSWQMEQSKSLGENSV